MVQNNCTLYSCTLQRGAYIGHNSVIMEGAIIQKGAIVAPNSVVPPGRVVKERQVWGGNPIKYIRKALEQEGFVTFDYARHLNISGSDYKFSFLPYNNAYLYCHGPSEPLERTVSTSNWQQVESDTYVSSSLIILFKLFFFLLPPTLPPYCCCPNHYLRFLLHLKRCR